MKISKITDPVKLRFTYDVYKDCLYLPTPEKYRQKMERYLEDPNTAIYAYEENGVVLGLLVLTQISAFEAEITGISVLPAARKKGIGTALMNTVKTLPVVFALLAETDEDAVGFYQKNGFHTEAVAKEYKNGTAIRYRCQFTVK